MTKLDQAIGLATFGKGWTCLPSDTKLALIYEWVKTNRINRKEFYLLIEEAK